MKLKKQIIYCSYDGLLDPLGRSQVIPYLEGISKNLTFSITIISFEKNLNHNQIIDFKEILNKKNIHWIPLSYTKKPAVISTIWDIIRLKIQLNKIDKYQKIELIHCRSYITSIVALQLKKKKNIPFIFDMRGFYADERVDGKIWNNKNFLHKRIYNYFKKKERQFIKYADYTISLTKNGKKEIESWKLPVQSPIEVIPCCTDENLFQISNINDKREELGINENDFIISYVGSIGTWYMLDEMLDFFRILLTKKPNSKFLFITKDDTKTIKLMGKKKKIDSNKFIFQSSSREMIPSYIGLSDISIFFILPVYSKKASSPTKMGEIMNLGIPIICNSGIGDVDKIMMECLPKYLIKSFNEKEYERVCNNVINSNHNRDLIISTSKKYYSLSVGIERYCKVYKKVINLG